MSAHPLVTILVAVYNGKDHIGEMLESVVLQSYTNFECIIVDDGSTDSTPTILNEYASRDSRFKILRKEQGGLTKSLNLGLAAAQGVYVARIDADDYMAKDRLEKQVVYLEAHQDVGLLGSAAYLVDGEGALRGTKMFPLENAVLKKILIRLNPFIHSSVMVRTGVMKSLGGYDESFAKAQDYDLWLRLAQNAAIANLEEPLVYKRYHAGNISVTSERSQIYHALRARFQAIRRGEYPLWNVVFLIRPALVCLMPGFARKVVRSIFSNTSL